MTTHESNNSVDHDLFLLKEQSEKLRKRLHKAMCSYKGIRLSKEDVFILGFVGFGEWIDTDYDD